MIQPFFSIVMPAYNCESTIGLTIDSILSQSCQDFELIIVNDGSADATAQVIQKFANEDARIHLITTPNRGPGSARNTGIQQAAGSYLYLIDSDDKLESQNLAHSKEIIERDQPDLVIGAYETKVYDRQRLVDQKVTAAPAALLESKDAFLEAVYPLMDQQMMYVVWNKVYRLDIVKENNVTFPPYRSCEDRIFNLQYFHHVEKCYVTDQIVYHYSFDGKNNLTNKYFDNKFETFKEFYHRAVELVPEDEAGFSALFLKGTMSCFISLHSPSCRLNRREKLAEIREVLRDVDVRRAAKLSVTTNLYKRIMEILFTVPIPSFHYFTSWVLYQLSILEPKAIERFKRNF